MGWLGALPIELNEGILKVLSITFHCKKQIGSFPE
jgi:hypothetical protein